MVGGETVSDQFLGPHIEMELQFRLDIQTGLSGSGAGKAQVPANARYVRHIVPYLASSRTSKTAIAYFFQAALSLLNCFRPSRVSW